MKKIEKYRDHTVQMASKVKQMMFDVNVAQSSGLTEDMGTVGFFTISI